MNKANKDFVESYDSRYKKGYMEGWPNAKKARVKSYIKSLDLPAQGKALDFGCGKGDFTVVLKQALPSWEIYGCDISVVALEMAGNSIPNCTFLTIDEIKQQAQKFDLLFSHHVIEHVDDLQEIFNDFGELVNEKGYMVHILPSWCENTFEHWVARSAINGIDPKVGNRYYYEHPGHLRRLSANDFAEYCAPLGFGIRQTHFSNKFFGTLDWISRTDYAFVKSMFSTKRAKGLFSKFLFLVFRIFFAVNSFLRAPSTQFRKVYSKRNKSKRKYLLFLTYLPLYPFSWIFDKIITFLSEAEWQLYRRSGSEMYLFFQRK